jgi:arsenite-transporting ATPase
MEYSNLADPPDDTQALMGMPGVDEIHALSSLFDSIERDDFDVVVFDTAPTGHTMRLLQLPQNFEAIMGGIGMFGGSAMAAIGQLIGGLGAEDMGGKMQRFQSLLVNAAKRLSNPMECTFVCVLVPEFSPLFETERLIQFLNDKQIETHILIVNQVMDSQTIGECRLCCKRYDMQQHYLHDIHDLYDDFLIVEIPLQETEIKGLDSVHNFSRFLGQLLSTGSE